MLRFALSVTALGIALAAGAGPVVADDEAARHDLLGFFRVGAVLQHVGGEPGVSAMPVTSELAVGGRYGRVSLGVFGSGRILSPDDEALHSASLTQWLLGTELRCVVHRRDELELYIGGAITRNWLHGSGEVQRTCGQTGACTAGFYQETPRYHGHGTRLSAGAQHRFGEGHTLGLIFAEVRGEHVAFDVLGDSQHASTIALELGVAFGAGRIRH